MVTLLALLSMGVSCGNKSSTADKNIFSSNDSLSSNSTNDEDKLAETGTSLMKNESFGKIKLGVGAKKIIEILGVPESKTKAELWGADGEYHQQWNYTEKGIQLDFMGDSVQVVNMITLSEPCKLKTSRNIGIGSSIEDVQRAYGKEINQAASSSESIVAGTIYGGIIFNIDNRKVKSIFSGASAE